MRSLILASIFVSAAAWAAPGDGMSDPMETLEILDASRACSARGGACVTAGAPTTVAAESEPLAAKRATPPPPRFRRAGGSAWTIELQAVLKRVALRGNAVFLVLDADDKEALAENQSTAMYQTTIHAGRTLAARMRFHPDEGFRAGHTYRLRVLQLVGGKELELTEVDFTLL
jgi:hypothetical protein